MKLSLLTLSLIIALFFAPSSIFAAKLDVAEGVITTAIVDRTPVDNVETVSSDAKLYCFTRITGAEIETTVTHLWIYNDAEMARVPLSIRSGNWRTYSSKNILAVWKGLWRVDVVDDNGEILKSLPFTVK